MRREAVAALFTAVLVLGAVPVAHAGYRGGTASCGLAAGHVAATAYQTYVSDTLHVTVGAVSRSGIGRSQTVHAYGARSARWSAASDSLKSARGYCSPE